MKWAILAAVMVVLSCTPSRPAPVTALNLPMAVPGDLRACADAPPTPPLPRTIQQIGHYTNALADAHADCVRTLRRLNRWLSDKQVTLDAGT